MDTELLCPDVSCGVDSPRSSQIVSDFGTQHSSHLADVRAELLVTGQFVLQIKSGGVKKIPNQGTSGAM